MVRTMLFERRIDGPALIGRKVATRCKCASCRQVSERRHHAFDFVQPRTVAVRVGRIVEIGDVDELTLPGLSARRQHTFPGGVVDLSALMEALELDRVIASQLGTREGILHQLLGHEREGDLRERTVLRLERRYGIDQEHGERVAKTLKKLAKAVKKEWPLSDDARRLLRFTAPMNRPDAAPTAAPAAALPAMAPAKVPAAAPSVASSAAPPTP